MKEHFENLGYTVSCLWSLNNEKKILTQDQEELRKYLIITEKYPPDLDILIVTEAYETGWNLSDKDVQTVIVHTTMKDSVTQARGRVRHDIELLYTKLGQNETNISLIRLDDKYLNKWLTVDDLSIMCEDLKLLDGKNRLISWKRLKTMLEDERYYSIETARKRLNGSKNPISSTFISVANQ